MNGGYLSVSIAVTIDLADVDEGGADEPDNRAPSFAAGVNVGSSVTATDPDDGDALNYTLSGADASSFEIDGSTGQITTHSGVTYDYESESADSLRWKQPMEMVAQPALP